MIQSHFIPRHLMCTVVIALSFANTGCIGFTSHLMYWIKGGHKIEAEYDGLEEKRVAIVCVANGSSYGPNSAADLLQRAVTQILKREGNEIELVHFDEIADWIDNNDWDQVDYREIGKGVEADKVVAIELEGFRLHEGRTLYRGQTDVIITVYDMEDGGTIDWREEIPEFAFPRNAPRHATEISESKFRMMFVQVLAQQVAKYFYDYNIETDFAMDATRIGS